MVDGDELHVEYVVAMFRPQVLLRTPSPVPLGVLVEDHIPRDMNAARHRVVRPERVGATFVADGNHLAPAIAELVEMRCCVLHMHDATEGLEVVHRRLLPIPGFKRRHAHYTFRQTSIQDID